MLPASLARIEREVPPDASVLDVGGWAKPLTRADWVIDLMPYATRGMLGADGSGPERFDASTWVQRDVCDREPWPFGDAQFDFAVCSHVLEDLRDPVWAVSELARVARAGYVEVPSRLEEQSWGAQGGWVGYGHHHWLVEVDDGALRFLFKPHIIHGRREFSFPEEFCRALTAEQRVQTLWWTETVEAQEIFLFEPGALEAELASFVARHGPSRAESEPRGLRRRLLGAFDRR